MIHLKTNYMLNLTSEAIAKNEFSDLLCGYGKYNIPDRAGFAQTDRSIVLYRGIYEYFGNCPNSNIKNVFEDTLITLMHGSPFELLTAFEYSFRQFSCEMRNTAPFLMNKKCLLHLQIEISKNEQTLKDCKQFYEFGKELPNSAWDYIRNVNKLLLNDYGKTLIDIP